MTLSPYLYTVTIKQRPSCMLHPVGEVCSRQEIALPLVVIRTAPDELSDVSAVMVSLWWEFCSWPAVMEKSLWEACVFIHYVETEHNSRKLHLWEPPLSSMAVGPKLHCYFPSFNHNSTRPDVTESPDKLQDHPVITFLQHLPVSVLLFSCVRNSLLF